MKKICIVIAHIVLSLNILNASIVDTITAKNIAKNFIYEKVNINNKINYENIDLQFIKTEKLNNKPAYYIYNLKNQTGFIIISAENETYPVLGYSYETNFDINKKPAPAFVGWMNHYKEQIEYIRTNNIKATNKIKQTWIKYNSQPAITKYYEKDIAPLLTTTWDQGTYYNELCPADAGGQDGHVWVGCVATAMAQVMKFWNYPDYGSDQNTYNDYTYGTQSADFENTYYDWASMPNSLSTYNTPVATLSYHCGVAVNMNYGTSGSGAQSSAAASALKRFFDYSHTLFLAGKNAYTDSTWNALIKSELDLGHPLYYSGLPASGSGHAFVCDGYQGTDYFHFNWGWGGSYNGYFYLNDLTPGSHDYTYNQSAIINCYPDCLNPQCGGSVTTITDLSGTLSDGSPTYGNFTNYSNCSNCEYLIQPIGASSIFITFDNFLTIEGEDSLYVYDGANDTAPLIYALSGDTVPNDFFSSTGSVYFHFVSDNFRTAPGWEVSYTTAFDDVGVTSIYLPQTKTCGKTMDTVTVNIKNFGANTETNIPITVDVITPSGSVSINTIFPGPLARNEWQTVVVGTINTIETGNYQVTAYTNLTGDTVINSNDTAYSSFYTKTIISVPHAEIFDDLHGQLGDWNDKNWTAFPDYDVNGTDTNYIMRGWVDEFMSMFLLYSRKINNITANTNLRFDYRFMSTGGTWPPTDSIVLNSNEMMHIIVSTDCGISFDTIYAIDTLNHINTSNFTTKEISLAAYAGQEIIVGFTTEWDAIMSIVDIDNVIFVDKISGNIISDSQNVCETEIPNTLTGSTTIGGIGNYTYLWQESSDNIVWVNANGTNNTQSYNPQTPANLMNYRRIISDTLVYSDTSNTVTITKVLNPVVDINGTLENCDSTVLNEISGNTYSNYLWSTNETDESITVNNTGSYWLQVTDTNGCNNSDTVDVIIHDSPVIFLGNDTTVFANQTVVLDAGAGFLDYTWSTPTGYYSSSTQTYLADSTNVGIGTGSYAVTVTDMYGCIATDSIEITYAVITDNSMIFDNAIRIFPNPTDDIINIDFNQPQNSPVNVSIINLNGKEIFNMEYINYVNTIKIRGLKANTGVYFIKLVTKSEVILTKLIISR